MPYVRDSRCIVAKATHGALRSERGTELAFPLKHLESPKQEAHISPYAHLSIHPNPHI